MHMMDEWFDEYVYEVVVWKESIPPELSKILDSKTVLLPHWEPMCALGNLSYRLR